MPSNFIQTFKQTIVTQTWPDPLEGALIIEDPFKACIKKGEKIGSLKCAADSISWYSIIPIVDHQLKVECIINPGSQIILMSDIAWG